MLRVLAAQSVVLALLAIVAADLAAHKRVEDLGGFNIRGYRGAVAPERQLNEIRLVFAGGTRAFGWGVPAASTPAASVRFELTRVLDAPGRPLQPVVAINLGQLGARPGSYPRTLEHFASLHPNYIVLIDDLGDPGPNRPFARSGIFELTGYRPILPLVLSEKGRVVHSRQSRLFGAALEYVGGAMEDGDAGLALVAGNPATEPEYATAMLVAVETAHREARGVVLALGPIDTDAQRRNFDALAARLASSPKRPWLRVVDLSEQADLYDPSARLDGFSFGTGATAVVARAIAPALLDLIGAGARNRSSRF